MVRLSGLFFLLPLSLAARIHGVREPRSIQKRPSVDVLNQQPQDAPILRLPMNRRPPKLTTTPPTITRHNKASLAFQHSPLHHTSSTPSTKPTVTPIAANTTAYFKDAAYGIKVWVGTYGQEVTLDFDTGSSETWVSPPCSEWAQYPEYEDLCRLLGTYVPEQSSTALEADCPSSWIMYGSGSVFIKYYTDTIQFKDPYVSSNTGWNFDSPSLYNVQFGLATDATNMPSGIFGAAYGGSYNQDYPSIIDEMHNQSLIASKDFSVALGSVGEEDGEVVFGGIDLAKFSGPLHEYEISHQLPKVVDGYYRYWVNLSSIGITEPDSCVTVPLTPKGFSERFLPDTGTSLTYMPTDAFNGILKAFPDANLTFGYGYVVECSHRERKGTIDYTFPDGFTVHVPFSEFIFVIPPGPSNGPVETCIIGAVPTDELFILGDTFLRSVYSVFSQEYHKIYFGHYKDCGTNVIPSRGLKNKGLKGDCPVEDRDHDPKEKKSRDQHYGYPTTPAVGSCTSYSTAPHPKSTPHTTSDDFWTEAFNNPGLLRPMIQTGARQVVTSTADEPTPTSLDKIPQRSIPNLPWSGNITATFFSTGHAASTGFHPLPTGTSSPKNASDVSTMSFPSVTMSNTTVSGSTTVLKKSSSTSSNRIDVPTSSKTSSRATAKSSFLTPFPQPTTCSSCTTSDHGTSLSTTWLDVSTSSSSYNWWTISSSTETSGPSVVTIPVQPDETIVVRLESTTYTIVDGSTISGGSDFGPTSTEISDTSWWTTESSTTVSSQGWDTSISWDSFTFTKETSTSSSSSTKKKKTHSTSTTTKSSSSSHKKTKTTTTSSSSTSTDWDFPTSASVSSTAGDKYLTSWRWDPTATSDFDPFYTSSSSSGYSYSDPPEETTLFDTRTNDFDPGPPATSSSSFSPSSTVESTSSSTPFSISSESSWDWPTSTEVSSSSETWEPAASIESDWWPTSEPTSSSSFVRSTSTFESTSSSSTKRTKSATKTSSTSSFPEPSSISSSSPISSPISSPSTSWFGSGSSSSWFGSSPKPSETSDLSWSFTESGSSVASASSSAIQSIQTGSASASASVTPTASSFSGLFPWPSGSFSVDWTSTGSWTGWPTLPTPSSLISRSVSTSASASASGLGDNGGGFESTVTVTGTVTHMVTVTAARKPKTTGSGIVPRDGAMTVTEACHLGSWEPDADCIMKSVTTQTSTYTPWLTGRPGLPDADYMPLRRLVRRDGDGDADTDNQPREGFKKIRRGTAGSGNDDGHDSGYESMLESTSESAEHSAEDGGEGQDENERSGDPASSPDCQWDVWC